MVQPVGLSLAALVQRARDGSLAAMSLGQSARPTTLNGTPDQSASPSPEQLRDLAGALRRSDKQGDEGHALARMLSGEPFLPMHMKGRNALATKIAYVLVGEFPNLDPQMVAQACAPGIEAARLAGSAMTVEKFARQLESAQGKRQLERNMVAQVRVLPMPQDAATGPVALPPLLGAPANPTFSRVLQHSHRDEREHDSIDVAVRALANSTEIYQRGGLLVHLARDLAPPRGVLRLQEAPRITEVKAARLREELSRLVNWFRPGRRGGNEPCSVPRAAVEGVQARDEWPGVRSLRGLAECPIVRPDGSIVRSAGYDEITGVYVAGTAAGDASAFDAGDCARELLDDLVGDFPFAGPEHKSAFLAALLTPLARYAFDGPTPLVLLDKNVRGSGGSLLADLIGIICTGRKELPRAPQTGDEEEETKRLLGLAVAGDPITLIDNVTGPLGSGALDRTLTSTSIKGRWLGGNKSVTAPWNCLLLATGNNIQLVGDTVRRALHVRLESHDERPEERSGFRHSDLRAYVLAERPVLLAMLLRILQAHLQASAPLALASWGSFEGWSHVVRGAVVRCGLPDPCASRRDLIANDSDADRAVAIVLGVQALGATSEESSLTLKAIVQRLPAGAGAWSGAGVVPASGRSTEALEGLRAALEEADARLDTTKLGYVLRRYVGRVVSGGLRLRAASHRTGVKRWYVECAR